LDIARPQALGRKKTKMTKPVAPVIPAATLTGYPDWKENMKKIVFVLVLLLVPSLCFAGSFYTNIVVLSVGAEKFVPLLLQAGVTAYYVLKDNTAVIFEKRLDDQNIEYGAKLTKTFLIFLNRQPYIH